MKLGEIKTITFRCDEHSCSECGEPAVVKHTFLLSGTRSNKASRAYGKDDCSWCEDACDFSCSEHERLISRRIPDGMVSGSTFRRNAGFEHLFLFWEKTGEEVIAPETEVTT